MAKRAPFVAVETDVRKEERIAVIADVCGYNEYEALGRLMHLWAWCADRGLRDAPDDCDSYAVPEAVVRRFLGPAGDRGILGDGCDELALGELLPSGLIKLRGTSRTVASLRGLTRSAAAGGAARESDGVRNIHGRFVAKHTITPADRPAGNQPSTSREPAVTSVDPRSQIPDPRSQIGDQIPPSASKARSRRLEPDWVPERGEANRKAEQQAKARGVDLRVELAKLRDWATGAGAKRADWDAVWRNWTRNARPESRRPGQQPTPLELQLEVVAMLESEEAEQKAAGGT